MKPLSLYIHIPFCARKCAYCDFASWPGREALWPLYFSALEAELSSWGPALADRTVTTVFFGGGTPSLPEAAQIAHLLEAARGAFAFAAAPEITLEANPGTLTPEKLTVYRAAGVNRLSLGVQSFDDGLLRALGRIHTAQEARDAVTLAREAGFHNLNVDLMYALPGQTMAQWADTLAQAVRLGVPHVSAYSLIVEDGTPMAARVATGEAVLPDEETVVSMQRLATRTFREAGLERYEISNYARPGYICRHNYAYWTRGEYLGLGCAAHSLIDETRFQNPADLDAYLAGSRALERQALSPEDQREECIMLSTRTTRGLSLDEYARATGEHLEEKKRAALHALCREGLLELDGGYLRLTEKGLELQNAVVLALLD